VTGTFLTKKGDRQKKVTGTFLTKKGDRYFFAGKWDSWKRGLTPFWLENEADPFFLI